MSDSYRQERGTSDLSPQPPQKWSEAESEMLTMAVSGKEDLGPEVNTKPQSLALARGEHLSLSQLADVAKLQAEFADVFPPLPGRTNLIQHHIETEPGVLIRRRGIVYLNTKNVFRQN